MIDMKQGDIVHVVDVSGETKNQINMGVSLHSDEEYVYLQTDKSGVTSYQTSDYEFRTGENIFDEIFTAVQNEVNSTYNGDPVLDNFSDARLRRMVEQFISHWGQTQDMKGASEQAALDHLPHELGSADIRDFAGLLTQVAPQVMKSKV